MCTMISEQAKIFGSGKGTGGWFTVDQINVSYDHPYHAPSEHALNIDFVNAFAIAACATTFFGDATPWLRRHLH